MPDDAPVGETTLDVDGDFTLGRPLDFEVTRNSTQSPEATPQRTPATTPTPVPVPTPTSPSPKPAAQFDYWAGGDSFSSGEGDTTHNKKRYERGTNSDTNRCHRSLKAFPHKVQQRLESQGEDYELIFSACSGAKIGDYDHRNSAYGEESAQRDTIDPERTRLVTITLGGNNAGFGNVVGNCMTYLRPDKTYNCMQHVEHTMTEIPKIDFVNLYGDLLKDAPLARIMVVGYPRMFDRDPRFLCQVPLSLEPLFYWPEQQRAFNDIVDQLNVRITDAIKQVNEKQPANNRRLEYVDVSELFSGHGICATKFLRWVNLLIVNGPIDEKSSYWQSFHPNVKGHSEIAKRVVECYAGGRCGPKQPRKYYGETYTVNEPLFEDADWRLAVTSYTYKRSGMLVRVQYYNKSSQPLQLQCLPGSARDAYLKFPSAYVQASETFCKNREGESWNVQPGETFKSYAIFNVKGMHGGEKFGVNWFSLGKSKPILMWK